MEENGFSSIEDRKEKSKPSKIISIFRLIAFLIFITIGITLTVKDIIKSYTQDSLEIRYYGLDGNKDCSAEFKDNRELYKKIMNIIKKYTQDKIAESIKQSYNFTFRMSFYKDADIILKIREPQNPDYKTYTLYKYQNNYYLAYSRTTTRTSPAIGGGTDFYPLTETQVINLINEIDTELKQGGVERGLENFCFRI